MFAPIPESRRVPGGAVYQIVMQGTGTVHIPAKGFPETVKLFLEETTPGSKGAEVPVERDERGLIVEQRAATALTGVRLAPFSPGCGHQGRRSRHGAAAPPPGPPQTPRCHRRSLQARNGDPPPWILEPGRFHRPRQPRSTRSLPRPSPRVFSCPFLFLEPLWGRRQIASNCGKTRWGHSTRILTTR